MYKVLVRSAGLGFYCHGRDIFLGSIFSYTSLWREALSNNKLLCPKISFASRCEISPAFMRNECCGFVILHDTPCGRARFAPAGHPKGPGSTRMPRDPRRMPLCNKSPLGADPTPSGVPARRAPDRSGSCRSLSAEPVAPGPRCR